jgi:hypothetical protein
MLTELSVDVAVFWHVTTCSLINNNFSCVNAEDLGKCRRQVLAKASVFFIQGC